ncbi:hypothetical protein SERLA73DRAFT_186612, partial [Serpula lacrymans var. lacrymans S7.3]
MENRIHKQLISKKKCHMLRTAAGPYQLLEGLFHGMIGHYNMYVDGWLHRKVSDSNILLLSEPEIQKPPTRFKFTQDLTKCASIIFDGDQAIKWRELLELKHEEHRSETFPYMSMRLLRAWDRGQAVLHTFADDLESFFW